MSALGTQERPVRVAVVGAGPAGFFTAEALLKSEAPLFEVDVFERLPTPFGLVRAGVAPDHQKIKAVTKTFDRTAKHGRFRFLGNVEVGKDIGADELSRHYDQVVYAIGSSGDRRLGIPGEELTDCHSATAFVGWYNAHPDFRDFPFDLTARRAVVVGVGNVALDIARVLLRNPDELAKTDIAGYALAALRKSQVREVVLLARRGPAQAAFEQRELQDIAQLPDVGIELDREIVEADALDLEALDARARRNVEYMLELARGERSRTERVLRLEFLASPVEILGNSQQRVTGVRVERNELVPATKGRASARGTGHFFELDAGLVFRSIGYSGLPLPGVPFDDAAGLIPNRDGRVTQRPGGDIVPALYAVGWIRRGPLGVIGTNKADAQAVAELMIADVPALERASETPRASGVIDELLGARGVRATSYDDWRVIDTLEVRAGEPRGKIREKFSSVEQMMNELLRGANQ